MTVERVVVSTTLEHVPVRIVRPQIGPDFPSHRMNGRPGKRGPRGSRQLASGRWSLEHACCIGVEHAGDRTAVPHAGQGLCRKCWWAERRRRRQP